MTIKVVPSLRPLRKSDPNYKKGRFILTSPLVFYWEAKDITVCVPEGFVTDLASIPRAFRPFIPVVDNHMLPAIIHDYLYSKSGCVMACHSFHTRPHGYTRKEADRIFKSEMKKEGVARWRRTLMYRAVRTFGGLHMKMTGGQKWRKNCS